MAFDSAYLEAKCLVRDFLGHPIADELSLVEGDLDGQIALYLCGSTYVILEKEIAKLGEDTVLSNPLTSVFSALIAGQGHAADLDSVLVQFMSHEFFHYAFFADYLKQIVDGLPVNTAGPVFSVNDLYEEIGIYGLDASNVQDMAEDIIDTLRASGMSLEYLASHPRLEGLNEGFAYWAAEEATGIRLFYRENAALYADMTDYELLKSAKYYYALFKKLSKDHSPGYVTKNLVSIAHDNYYRVRETGIESLPAYAYERLWELDQGKRIQAAALNEGMARSFDLQRRKNKSIFSLFGIK